MSEQPEALSAAQARELLAFDPDTGTIVRKIQARGYAKGNKAGFRNFHGYTSLRVAGKTYRAHMVAWLLHYGEWPRMAIDHINGDKTDNSIKNLRLATPSINSQNLRSRVNRTGFPGVHKNGSGWSSAIRVNNKRHSLGTYSTPEEAYAAYLRAKTELHPGASNHLVQRMKDLVSEPHKKVEELEKLLSHALETLELARSYCGVGHVESACDVAITALRSRLEAK